MKSRWAFLWMLLVLVLWGCTFLLFCFVSTGEKRGQFGDMFGAVNALFSGLAFFGVIWAIVLQKRELELQRSELAMTRDELRGQKEQMQRQSFESTFFQMVRLHHDIVNGMVQRDGSRNVVAEGRDCFREYVDELRKKTRAVRGDRSRADVIRAGYRKAYTSRFQSKVGHYFRNLYHIVKFVHNSEVDDRDLFVGVVRAQLSADELVLLFYNGLILQR